MSVVLLLGVFEILMRDPQRVNQNDYKQLTCDILYLFNVLNEIMNRWIFWHRYVLALLLLCCSVYYCSLISNESNEKLGSFFQLYIKILFFPFFFNETSP